MVAFHAVLWYGASLIQWAPVQFLYHYLFVLLLWKFTLAFSVVVGFDCLSLRTHMRDNVAVEYMRHRCRAHTAHTFLYFL